METNELHRLRTEAVAGSPWAASLSWRHLLDEVANAAAKAADSPAQFGYYVDSGFAVVDELVYAFNPNCWEQREERAGLVYWSHQDFQRLVAKEPKVPFIVKQSVESAIASYVRLPYRSDALDRLLLDLALAQEITAFAAEMHRIGAYRGYPVGKWLLSLAVQLSIGAGLAIGIVWLDLGAWSLWVASAIAGVTLLSVAWSLVAFPLSYPRFRRAKQRIDRITQSMRDAYTALDGAMSSIKHVQERVKAADDAGVVWISPTYVLIEDIKSRRAYL